MQKTAMNPNPEQEMAVNPFAQEQTAEIQPQENAQTYPVGVDGDIVELTLEELIDAAAQGLSSATPTSAATARQTPCRTARSTPHSSRNIPMSVPDIPQQVWEWAQQEGSLVSAYRKWEIAELRDELAALEMNQKNRRAAVGPAQSDGEPNWKWRMVTLAFLGK